MFSITQKCKNSEEFLDFFIYTPNNSKYWVVIKLIEIGAKPLHTARSFQEKAKEAVKICHYKRECCFRES